MRWMAAGFAVAFLLAGCSDAGAGEGPAGLDFSDLDLDVSATTGIIRGVVVDEAIRPLGGADITLTPGGKTARSTDDGRFGFDGLEPGTYFLSASRLGYATVQTSTDVVAGVAEPAIVRVLMTAVPGSGPYLEVFQFNGFLTFGAAVFATSVGTTVFAPLSDALSDTSIWAVNFTEEPDWLQGELVWEHNQPAGGALIWEMTRGCTNTHAGYRETTTSPALAYWNTTVIRSLNETNVDEDLDYDLLEDGLCYRFFGGPHEVCRPPDPNLPPPLPRNPWIFGCGLTTQQRADAYVHHFYNFAPPEGWRFTADGAPVIPV
jgi:hypothetical protein